MKRVAFLAFAFSFLLATPAVQADPRLPAILGDHLVLQRDREVRLWGWADPGEHIAITVAGHSRETTTAPDGRWNVTLPAMRAGGPFTIQVAGKKTIAIRDVLFGEVWLASGQSNMQFSLGAAKNAAADLPAAECERIRLFKVPKLSVLEPAADTQASWQTLSPAAARDFSAVAYYFGRQLYTELGVPVGLIDSSWGGTQAEEWTARPFLQRDPVLTPILDRWEGEPPATKSLYHEPQKFDVRFDGFEFIPKDESVPPLPLSDFGEAGGHLSTGGDLLFPSGGVNGFDLVQDDKPGTTPQRGWVARVAGELQAGHEPALAAELQPHHAPLDLLAYRGIRFFVRGQGFFRVHFYQPSITDFDNYGSAAFAASPEWKQITVLFDDLHQAGWGHKHAFTPEKLTGFGIGFQTGLAGADRPPAGLYNGMIAPLLPYTIRGALWYQGEGNSGRSYQYRKLLPALIASWREAWQAPDLPFLVVQLPGYGPMKAQPSESGWAELREAQLMTARSEPHTGVAVTIDQGEWDDVHPRDKSEVGRRLTLWALANTYGRKIEYSGPVYESAEPEGAGMRVRFSHVARGLVLQQARGPNVPGVGNGFAIAGEDHKFHWARAKVEGDSIFVWSPEVPKPVAVRYAWAQTPDYSLFNSEGLPASPFRTDGWPGITANER